MGRSRIGAVAGETAVRTVLEHGNGSRDETALAVRYLLQLLADAAPGNTLEVRVPPFGAVQCVDGPAHTRGTPPNVIEMDAGTWIALATGRLGWTAAVAADRVSASGSRASLAGMLPLEWNAGQ